MKRYDSKWGNLLKDRVAPIDEKIRKIMFRGERLMHRHERVSWSKLKEQKKGRGRPKIISRSNKKGHVNEGSNRSYEFR